MSLDARGLARAAAWRARQFARARRLSRAIARRARMQAGHADFRIHASNRFFKTDRNRTFDILPSLWMARPVPAANNVSEDLAEVGRARSRKIEPLEAEPPVGSRAALFQNAIRVKAVDVVEFALQGITENVVCLRDPLEALFRMTVTRVDVRVIPPGQFPKGSFDFNHRCRSADLENDVKIFPGHDLRLLLFLLLIRIDVFRVDDVVGFSAGRFAGAIGAATRLTAGLGARFVHRLGNLVRCLSERIRRPVDGCDIAAFQSLLGIGDGALRPAILRISKVGDAPARRWAIAGFILTVLAVGVMTGATFVG